MPQSKHYAHHNKSRKVGLRKKLFRSHLIIASFGLFILLIAAGSLGVIRHFSLILATNSGPAILAAKDLKISTVQTLASIRGWMANGDPQLLIDQKNAWANGVYPAINALEQILEKSALSIHDNDMTMIKKHLIELEELQWHIGDVGQTPGNNQARAVYLTTMKKILFDIDQSITGIVQIEKSLDEQGRRSILGFMGEIRWSVSTCELALMNYIEDAHLEDIEKYKTSLENIDYNIFQLKQLITQLTKEQYELFQYLVIRLTSIKPIAIDIIKQRNAPDAIVSQYLLNQRAIPLVNEINAIAETVFKDLTKRTTFYSDTIIKINNWLPYLVFTLFLGLITIALYLSNRSANLIMSPILLLTSGVKQLTNNNQASDIIIETNDELEMLASGFNTMRISLQDRQERLEETNLDLEIQAKLDYDIAMFNQHIRGQQSIAELCDNILTTLSHIIGIHVGAIYLDETMTNESSNSKYKLVSTFTLDDSDDKFKQFPLGSELIAQCVSLNKIIFVDEIAEGDLHLDATAGNTIPPSVIAVPLIFDNVIIAVIELARTAPFDNGTISFIEHLLDNIGIAFNTNLSRIKLERASNNVKNQMFAIDEHAIVSITDVNGKISYANNKFCEISGYTREELYGSYHRVIKSDEHDDAFWNHFWVTISSGKVWQGQIKNFAKDGTIYWVDSTIVPMKDTAGNIIEYMGIRRDITESKQMEIGLTHAMKSAHAAELAKGSFLANMSHELRTPMNGILGYSEMILETNLSDESREYATTIFNCGDMLLNLIDDILDYSKIEAGEIKLESITIDMKALLKETHSLLKPKINIDNINYFTSYADELSDFFIGDPTRLKQIFINLLSNAAKFTKNGEIELGIKHISNQNTINNKAQTIQCFVRDTGIGIPEEKLPTIMERFKQADNSTTREFGGTGLGLSISRMLVQCMGGDISVESHVGSGSTFYFDITLPISTTRTVTKINDDNINDDIDITELKILIAEDNTINQKLIKQILLKFGAHVIIAKNGQEAIDIVNNDDITIDIIFMDMQMPIINGIDSTIAIRKSGFDNIPIIALTANAQEEDQILCLASGMNDFISKPLKRQNLVEMINKWAPSSV